MSSVQEFALSVLLGDSLEAKLALAPARAREEGILTQGVGDPLSQMRASSFVAPRFPGRPGRLAQIGKADFPGSLRLDSERGRVLHFFANHELLALELMALALLKFPEAPAEFRASLVRTIGEEQDHLRLYLARMRELGVDFGDLPVSDYFWKAMREVRSPLEFVTQMSLTLEQANLDFSLHYRDAVRAAGDEATARILDQVYQDEIGHVKNGLAWFERWRHEDAAAHQPTGAPESTWDAYRRLLPPPMTPSRAKGRGFTEEGRRAAGFDEDFIRALKLESSSKGRPPMLRWYEPEAERQIAHSRRAPSGFSPTATAERLARDLEPLLTFVGGRHDLLRVRELPSLEWRESCARAGFELPEYVLWDAPLRERKLAGVSPWAWTEAAWRSSLGLRERLTPASGGNAAYCGSLWSSPDYPLAGVFSKGWADEQAATLLDDSLVRDPQGRVYHDEDELRALLARELAAGRKFAAKALYGASGTQVQRLDSLKDLEGPRGGWLSGVIRDQGGIWLEPWVNIEAELSIQFEVRPERVEILGIRQFETGPRREFRGTWLDPQLRALGAERLAFFHSGQPHPLTQLLDTARLMGERLRKAGYQGPAGIDSYLWRDDAGQLRFQPLSELNPRHTMGRIAIELEKRIKPGTSARWRWIFRKEVSALQRAETVAGFAGFARELAARHPVEFSPQGLIQSGVFFTNDPECAREVLTYLEVT